jgi:hypothetical protein
MQFIYTDVQLTYDDEERNENNNNVFIEIEQIEKYNQTKEGKSINCKLNQFRKTD